MPAAPAFRALCALLVLGFAAPAAHAFYMPPTFNAAALPGSYTNTSYGGYPHSDAGTGTGGADADDTGTADSDPAVRNQTCGTASAKARRAGLGSGSEPRDTHGVGARAVAKGTESGSGSDLSDGAVSRDVWAPHITAPEAGAVWKVGETVEVTWDTSDRPEQVTNPKGTVVLGYLEHGDEDNEHLDFEHPLADDIDLSSGCILVEVPDVVPADNYIIVVFGDSGDKSPMFTIVN